MSNTTINNAALDIFGNLAGVNANVTTLRATGQINATGNIVATVFAGNGSLLNGVSATVASGPKFSMYRSDNQTIFSNSSLIGANINYNGIIFDTHSACNVTTGSFTAPLSGYYQFITSTSFPAIDNVGTFEIRLVKNTTQPIAILNNPWCPPAVRRITTRTTYPARALVNLTVGDVVNVRAFNQTGSSIDLFGNSSTNFTVFSGYYVGA